MSFVILDRDGVINYDSSEYIKTPAEWVPIPGSLEAIALLNRAGFEVLIATNQSGVARGHYTHEMLNQIHEKFLQLLTLQGGRVKEIFYCPHHPDDDCFCRKPKPGMLHQMREKYAIPLAETFFVGDSLVDIEAARAAQCRPLLVLTGRGRSTQRKLSPEYDVPTFIDLAEAASFIIEQQS
ncbi:MAG: D-glycero-beta-D-manno-heptose-1,7-bisphosphate 7-phosphatase [Gammaproteobacteria bacterium RIFCSPHIGHO2_12_FULL_38_14]|nr:MAG: D-glycero-beta-D-manno-heptose-1,7-bisphosphate 7-phosphatase [Gammaproteobacteria bacterium RIFCSPHIGHO2_12_FULL_38_14]